jgi:hypothetical protein
MRYQPGDVHESPKWCIRSYQFFATYQGLRVHASIDKFMAQMTKLVHETQRIQAMEVEVTGTPACKWAMHRKDL